MWQNLLPQTLIVQFLSNFYLFAAEGNQMSGLSAFDQLSSVHKENLNSTSKPNFSWSHMEQFPSELLFLYDMCWKMKFFNFSGGCYHPQNHHRSLINSKPSGRNYGGYRYHERQMNFSFICHQKKRYTEQVAIPSSNTKLNITCYLVLLLTHKCSISTTMIMGYHGLFYMMSKTTNSV